MGHLTARLQPASHSNTNCHCTGLVSELAEAVGGYARQRGHVAAFAPAGAGAESESGGGIQNARFDLFGLDFCALVGGPKLMSLFRG